MRFTLLILLALTVGCSSHSGRMALLSDGELAGKDLSGLGTGGPLLYGSSCWPTPSLSLAFMDAIDGTGYDTLVDIEVVSKSNYILPSCIAVEGHGVDSRKLPPVKGGGQ